jgi:hypothetical protein
MEAVPPKRRDLSEPLGATTQKTVLFIFSISGRILST